MRKSPFVTIATAPNSKEAEILAGVLRHAGLYPADVPLVAASGKGREELLPC